MAKKQLLLAGCVCVGGIVLAVVVSGKLLRIARTISRWQSTPDSNTSLLTGIDGVFVGVHLHYEENYTNDEAVAYKVAIEDLLHKKGIPVLSVDDLGKRYDSDRPAACLVVMVTAKEAARGDGESSLVFTTSVDVREEARLVRPPEWRISDARVWTCTDFGQLPASATCEDLCETARSCIDSFVKEYKEANR